MISTEEASRIIQSNLFVPGTESVPITNAIARVLREALICDTDLPPFDRVMMDGIAIRSSDFTAGHKRFDITGIQRAGGSIQQLGSEGTCLEVMTGSICPEGADVIIPYEQLDIKDNVAEVKIDVLKPMQNIHRVGSDKKKGEVLVREKMRIGPAEIGIAASIGKTKLEVASFPRIHIYSTGDELVDIGETPLPWQIRRSNVYAIQQLIYSHGALSTESHLPDDEVSIKESLSTELERNDVIILTGGVSKGKYDLIPDMLRELGVEQLFHRVEQRPGKPMWFGRNKKAIVFAFPGNPVSTIACAARYLVPWLETSMSGNTTFATVQLREEIFFNTRMTHFVPVRIETGSDGNQHARAITTSGSGDFASLAGMSGFIEVPSSTTPYPPSTAFPYYKL